MNYIYRSTIKFADKLILSSFDLFFSTICCKFDLKISSFQVIGLNANVLYEAGFSSIKGIVNISLFVS